GPFGHRYGGTIAALGAGAPALEVGQPVMGVHSAPCGECGLCRRQRPHLCPHVMRDKALGAFGQYLRIPAPVARLNLFPRPPRLPSETAALLEPVACVVHALELVDWCGVDRVLVLGLGAMGLLFAQLLPRYTRAALEGAGRRSERVRLARGWGLSPVYDLTAAALAEQLPAHERYDAVIECTGKLDGWQEAFARAAPGGQVILFGGLPAGTVFPADSFRLHYEEVSMRGSFHFAPRDVAKARDLLLDGAVDPAGLVTATARLDDMQETMEKLARGEGVQYAIDPWA
ncbi:MAG: zinc-binding dehydrogenase, partial [Gemmataceae bacterium]|nr:zinc-binding dehydrogenase [Gemmataceae bacterium]